MPARRQPAHKANDDADELLSTVVPAQVRALYGASQHSVASHRKHVNALYALFLRASKVRLDDGENVRLTGEKAFVDALRAVLVYVLAIKRGVEQADRLVKFTAAFIGFAVEQDQKERQGEEDEDDEDEGPATRLVAQLLVFLLKGFHAKNKHARFRCVQLVALMVNSLGEIDDDGYQRLKHALLERVFDKESSVRVQAVVALAKLQEADSVESDDEDDEDSDDEFSESRKTKVADVLIDVLEHDAAAEVRRAALFNLIPTQASLHALATRTLDVDITNRRVAYTHVLADVPVKAFTREERAEIVARGLKEREPAVKRAAGRLVAKWAEDLGGAVEFLQAIGVEAQTQAAELAVKALVEHKPELIELFSFDDEYYETATPESALLARVFLDTLRATEDVRLSQVEPVATSFAGLIGSSWASLRVQLDGDASTTATPLDVRAAEFVLSQLLLIAADNMGDGDEMGRRKTFELMREMVEDELLPLSLMPRCLDVLLRGTSERDFLRIGVESVQSLRLNSGLISEDEDDDDDDDDDEDDATDAVVPEQDEAAEGETDADAARRRVAAAAAAKRARLEGRRERRAAAKLAAQQPETPEQAERKKQLDLRCLALVGGLLERVAGALNENSSLHGIVHELIVPAVRSKEPEVRANGLVCLGLCSLLDKKMALDSFGLFVNQSANAGLELRVKTLQVIFDLLLVHGVNFTAERGHGEEQILSFLLHATEDDEPEWLAAAVIGTCKLLLTGLVMNEEILERLVLLYFASETANNQPLRQCLSYFLPVYAYSAPANQRRLASIVLSSLELLKGVYEDLPEKGLMVAPPQIATQLLDWTDPQKAVHGETVKVDDLVHFDLAMDIVKDLLSKDAPKDERKLYCQLLNKLYVPDSVQDIRVKVLVTLLESINQHRPLSDAVARNALSRLHGALLKRFDERLAALTEEQIQAADEMQAAHELIKSVLEEQDSDAASTAGRSRKNSQASTRGRKQSGARGGKRTPARSRRAPSSSDSDSDDTDEDDSSKDAGGESTPKGRSTARASTGSAMTPASRKAPPRRAAAAGAAQRASLARTVEASSDEDGSEEDSEEESEEEVPRKPAPAARRRVASSSDDSDDDSD